MLGKGEPHQHLGFGGTHPSAILRRGEPTSTQDGEGGGCAWNPPPVPNVVLRRQNAAGTQDGGTPPSARYNCREGGDPPGAPPPPRSPGPSCVQQRRRRWGPDSPSLAMAGSAPRSVGGAGRARRDLTGGAGDARGAPPPPRPAPPAHRAVCRRALGRRAWYIGEQGNQGARCVGVRSAGDARE